jgi:four helix bundle protein
MRNNQGYRTLIAWQLANKLAHLVYDITADFPKSEVYGLTSQMRRAVLSIGANIAEGYSRKSLKDRGHFYQISTGSLTEIEFFIDFAFERDLIKQINYKQIVKLQEECAKVLNGLSKSTRL